MCSFRRFRIPRCLGYTIVSPVSCTGRALPLSGIASLWYIYTPMDHLYNCKLLLPITFLPFPQNINLLNIQYVVEYYHATTSDPSLCIAQIYQRQNGWGSLSNLDFVLLINISWLLLLSLLETQTHCSYRCQGSRSCSHHLAGHPCWCTNIPLSLEGWRKPHGPSCPLACSTRLAQQNWDWDGRRQRCPWYYCHLLLWILGFPSLLYYIYISCVLQSLLVT